MLGRTLFRRVGALGMAISVGQAALSRLSDEERQEFADLVRKLELGRLGRRVAFSAMPFGGRR
jgi:hypothetical protein